MTSRSSMAAPPDRPVVVVLATHWESRSEEGWIARQVAGALANRADVHVVTPDGSDEATLTFPHFDPLFRRAASVLTVTEAERSAVVGHHGGGERVHRIGAPLSANPSARTEPNAWIGDAENILVLTGVDQSADDEEGGLARLLRVRFPDVTVGVAHQDAFCAWRHG